MNSSDGGFSVKWEPDATTPDQGRGHIGLGEIGSPMPNKISPAGFGAPGMGRVGGAAPGGGGTAPGGGAGFQSLGAVGSTVQQNF